MGKYLLLTDSGSRGNRDVLKSRRSSDDGSVRLSDRHDSLVLKELPEVDNEGLLLGVESVPDLLVDRNSTGGVLENEKEKRTGQVVVVRSFDASSFSSPRRKANDASNSLVGRR